MNRDQLETHCGDSGVRLDDEGLRVKYVRYFVEIQVDPSLVQHLIGWIEKRRLSDDALGRDLRLAAFPEPATDPWEEQG